MDTKAVKGILIGYEGDDGYRIFLQPGNRTCRSRDVIFDEKVVASTPGLDWPVNACPDECVTGSIPEETTAKHESPTDNTDEETDEETKVTDENVPVMQLRDRKQISQPTRYKDFVMTAEGMFDSSAPDSFEEALHSEQRTEWQEAMENEIQSLNDNQTWELVDLPIGKKAIPCKWVYRVKYHSDGSIERYKARLVIKGYSQKKGVDYDQTFSPVVRNATIRTLLSVAASEKMHLMQFDVSTAFLYGDLEAVKQTFTCISQKNFLIIPTESVN